MINALSIDVEDYFMVSAFADVVKHEDWHKYESRVESNMRKILTLLDERRVKATFFVLGWVAEKCPELVKEIHAAGHEVASHGYTHRLVYDMKPEEFRAEIRKTNDLLQHITGLPVKGFRAPSYSIVKKSLWALDILIEEGFSYDSSIVPIHHDRYGFPEADRFPHQIRRSNGIIWEFPPSTYRLLGNNLPVGGGGYFRLLPSWITRSAIKSINNREGRPVVFYLHPWEIDPSQPRLRGKWLSEFRHYNNLKSTMPKLKTLLDEFDFKPISGFINEQ